MTILPVPKAVIFDWDDTVVSNWETAVKALNAALVHMGEQPWSEAEARRRAGASARDLFTQLFGARWQEADKVYYDTFYSLVLDNVRVYDHIVDVFEALRARGVFMAVVSNKRGPLLRREVSHLGFDRYFGAIVGAGDAPADKPDPAPVYLALQQGGIAPGPDVWFLGDSHTDMICAIRAGCTPVLIETKKPPEDLLAPNPPRRSFGRHFEIMEYIKSNF
jgi:phosphoglycolate phosphatase